MTIQWKRLKSSAKIRILIIHYRDLSYINFCFTCYKKNVYLSDGNKDERFIGNV